MAVFVDISDRKLILKILLRLKADEVPFWGKMKPQQMLEHLVESVEYTNGKYSSDCIMPPAEARKMLEANVYSDVEIPRNVILGTLPAYYKFNSLGSAYG